MNRLGCAVLLTGVLLTGCSLGADTNTITSLAGRWRFQLDREDVGIDERWFERTLDGTLRLPGALQNQGFGDDVTVETAWTGDVGADRWRNEPQYARYREPDNIKIPWLLQPDKHYVGPAWVQCDVEIPTRWQGRRIVLTLERAHWETRLWCDARLVDTHDSLSTPHIYDLGTELTPGRHTLTLRVDNRVIVDVGAWSHSVTDHTQGNWNGLIGRLDLTATSGVWIEDAQVYPDVARHTALVNVRLGNVTGRAGRGQLTVGSQTRAVRWDENGGAAEIEVPLAADAQTWDEFNPVLQTLRIQLTGEQADDQREVTFGLRQIATEGREFLLNGRKLFLRGTLECCIFPRTGYPPTDVASWKRIIRICKAHGLNHMRFHSWCPPEAAFVAADELGFYYQVECAVWTNPGDGKPIDAWIYKESERIVRAYGNHPSFLLLTHGNEPHGPRHKEFLAKWVDFWKARDNRRLVTSGSAYPQLPENQYHVYHGPRGPGGWLGRDYRGTIAQLDVPVVVHEMGQWCVYPNFDEMDKYTGPLKARNFEIFRESLADHGMLSQWHDFFMASGKLQVLCYKEEIEAALRTPGIGGFQLLDLHDFPGQGTALVGVLDAFWDAKEYVTPEQYRRFCNTTVPLARLLKRTWTTDEVLTADVEAAHFGPEPLTDAVPVWKLVTQDGQVVAQGQWPARTLPVGAGISLGQVRADLSTVRTPAACKLVVSIKNTPFENDWGVWVYEARPPETKDPEVLVTSSMDESAWRHLAEGRRVLLHTAKLSRQHPRLGFEPIFWNRYMFNTQGRQTLGLLCDPNHPALTHFPTEFHCNWQWAEILKQGRGMVLDDLPGEIRPIVQVIDDWNTNRKLALVWECRVGLGQLLVCSADLAGDLDGRPAVRQLRTSLTTYAAGPNFKPQVDVTRGDLTRLLEQQVPPSTLVKLAAKVVQVDSEDRANGNTADKAIDGDPDTIWHTRWQPRNDPMPHHLVIDLGRTLTLKGLTYLPRQDMANGRVAEAGIYCSLDAESWGAPVASVRWPNTDDPRNVQFGRPVETRYLKLLVTSEVNGNPFAGVAELDVILAGP